MLGLAEKTGLSELIQDKVALSSARVKSAGSNPAGKLTAIVAGMAAGADSIDDLEVIRSGGMGRVFAEVYAAATLGQFLREFTHGHVAQLASVARAHLVNLIDAVPGLLPDRAAGAVIDIDSLLRPVYGHAKEGASFGHTKIGGRKLLRKGLSPLATTISARTGSVPPLLAGIRLRAGKAASSRGAASMVTEAILLARACGVSGEILVRGDAAYGNSSVAGACLRHGARFSLTLGRTPALDAAIAAIPAQAWTAVHYPGAVPDPDHPGQVISDAEVAEVAFTAFTSTTSPVTARLVVRRVRDRAKPCTVGEHGELFPVWRYHPFLTDSSEDTAAADITHRRHAVIETVFADLIAGPLAHLPCGRFPANAAWATCAMITHNLLRAAGTLAGGQNTNARGATLRRRLVTVPARPARPQRRPVLHLPAHWPWAAEFTTLHQAVFGTGAAPPQAA